MPGPQSHPGPMRWQLHQQCRRRNCPFEHRKSLRRHCYCCNACRRDDPWHTENCTGYGKRVLGQRASSSAGSAQVLPEWLTEACSVCLDSIWEDANDEPIVAFKCKHALHYVCFGKLRQAACPVCRRNIKIPPLSFSAGRRSRSRSPLSYPSSDSSGDCCDGNWIGWYCPVCSAQH